MQDFSRDRNPLRLDLLPTGWEKEALEFSYRTQATRGNQYQNPFTGYVIVSIGLSALMALASLRLFAIVVDVETFLYSPWLFALLTLAALTEAVPSFQRDEAPSVWLFRLILPFTVWAAVVLIVQPSWLLLLLLLVASLLLSDLVADSYVRYLIANPELDYDTRIRIQTRWKERLGPLAWQAAGWAVFARRHYPQELLDLYPVFFVTIPLAYALAIFSLLKYPGITAGLLVLLALAAFLFLHTLFVHRVLISSRPPLRHSFRVIWHAFERWFNYNPRHEQAPGLHQSPYGSAFRRTLIASLVLITASAGLNLTTRYFPVLMFGPEGASPWAQVVAEREPQPKPAAAVDEADRALTVEDLPAHQRLFFSQLDSDEDRQNYLANVAERRRAAPAAEPAPRIPEPRHYAQLGEPPESWLMISWLGMFKGNALFIWSFILSLLLGVAVPPLFMFLTCWSVASHSLGLIDLRLSRKYYQQYPRDDDMTEPSESPQWYNREWLAHVDALLASENALEREHLFLGYAQHQDHDGQVPVLCHRSLIGQHVHISGDSGSGKTARGIAAMAAQLIRFAKERRNCSVIIIDLKGDDSLFHGVHAESDGLPFRWYRDFQSFSSFAFNPLGQSYMEYLDSDQKANVIMDSFGLRYGDTLGGRYFADIQQHVLRRVLHARPGINSLGELHRVLQDPRTRDDFIPHMSDRAWDNAFHIREEVDAFSRREPLNRLTGPSIDLASLFVEPQVVYFYVPAILGGDANRQAAKFALYTLLTAGSIIPPGSRHQVYCFIDEFQQMIGANIGVILQQSRGYDVGLILANQMLADLKQGGTDLSKSVLNTAFRWSFRTSDLDHQDALMKASGEYIDTLATTGYTLDYNTLGYTESRSHREEYRPALDTNALLWASFVEDLSVAHFSKGSGYTQFFRPFALKTMFHVSEELFRQRARRDWPELPDDVPQPESPFGPDLPARYRPRK